MVIREQWVLYHLAGDAQGHPWHAYFRHPWLKKPRQDDTTLTAHYHCHFPLWGGVDQELENQSIFAFDLDFSFAFALPTATSETNDTGSDW